VTVRSRSKLGSPATSNNFLIDRRSEPRGTDLNMKIQLLKTIREVIHADSDPVRQSLFDHLRRSNSIVKLVWTAHHIVRQSYLSSALVFLFGIKSYATADTSSETQDLPLIIAIHKNAKKQGNKIAAWLGPERVSWLFPLVNRLNRRHDFLVSCRTASAIFSYVRAVEILEQQHPSGVIVSSDSNPEPLAFTRAASACGLPTIFMSHAYPTPVSPPLQFTLSILEGETALQRYQAKGPVEGDVMFCGAEGTSKPMEAQKLTSQRPVIGIFASKVVCWPKFISLIEDCREQFNPKKILIRWHPNMLGSSKLSSERADTRAVVETDPKLPLQEVASQCDWVIADENSNVNLGVLKSGIPILPMKEFSVLPESRADLYGFVNNEILPQPVKSVRGVSLEQLAQFYSNDWAERFGRYDASYFESAERLADQALDAILRVLSEHQVRGEK